MAVSPLLVKQLRDKTGAGMADCKAALEEANGNEERAIEILRKRGAASASKRADRVAKEGVIVTAVGDDKKKKNIPAGELGSDIFLRHEKVMEFSPGNADGAPRA